MTLPFKLNLNTKSYIFIVILLVAIFLRFYNFHDRIYLGSEQSRDYFTSLVMRDELQFPLVGPFSSIAPLTGGPWYWLYLAVGWVFIPSVYAPWIALGAASSLAVFFMYKIGCLLRDQTLGILLAFFAGLSPTLIENTVYLTNPFLVGFLSTLAVYLFIKTLTVSNVKVALLFGFIVGVTILTHYQALGLLALIIGLLFKKDDRFKTLLYVLGGLVLAALPVLFFELNNHWFNTRHFFEYVFDKNSSAQMGKRWLTFVSTTFPLLWHGFLGIPRLISLPIIFISFVAAAYLFFTRKLLLAEKILLIILAVEILVARYFGGEVYVARMQFLLPFVFILNGIVLYPLLLKFKVLFVPFMLVYLILVFPAVSSLIGGTTNLPQILSNLSQVQDKHKKISLYYCHVEQYPPETKDYYLLGTYINKMYDPQGRKIAIKNDTCKLSGLSVPIGKDLVDITDEDPQVLEKYKWIHFSPQFIYDGSSKWYYAEKP